MTDKPIMLDAFCGAGGAAKGYQRAGFYVIGVDIDPQPNYCGDEFFQADAMKVLAGMIGEDPVFNKIDAIHASPPCQHGTAYKRRPRHVRESPNLVAPVRQLLKAAGLPYVIEQPESCREHLVNPIRLCGSSFGLDIRRHRLFESSRWLSAAPPCRHAWQMPRFPAATNRTNLRRTVEVGVWRIPIDVQQQAMGIDWMTLGELSQAIPPAYTEFIGGQLIDHLGRLES